MYYYNSINKENYASINIDKKTIRRVIVSCAVECKGSIEDIQAHLKNIFDIHISEGSISNILTEAAGKAKVFNDSIPLDGIKIGVSDEIFQAGSPVLVGVEPLSTYVYLMNSSEKRDSTAWWIAYSEKQENQGLNIEESVTDGGSGMKKGIKETYENVHEQYDILKILIMWIHELLNTGGYSYEDRTELINFILEELSQIGINSSYLDEAMKTLSSNKERLLYFVKKAEKLFLELSIKEGISLDTLNLFWQQYGINSSKNKYWILDSKLKSSLSNTYCKIKAEAAKILKTIVRCSSIVENINSQIRPYLFLKRVLKGKFLDLLQFYLNTRKYLNSRVEERKGKSPLELLTGKNYGNWLDILGY